MDQWVEEQMKLPWWREFPKSEFDCQMDREAWRAAIHGVARSRTGLSDWSDLICQMLGYEPHGVLVSYSCYNKLLHTWRLKITELYSVTDLEALGVWNQSVSRPMIPPMALGENLSLPLLVSGGSRFPWLMAAALQCLNQSSCSLLLCGSSLLLSLIKTQHWL